MMYDPKMVLFISIYHNPTPIMDESVLSAPYWLHGKFWTLDLLQDNPMPVICMWKQLTVLSVNAACCHWGQAVPHIQMAHYNCVFCSLWEAGLQLCSRKNSGTFQDLTPHHCGWFCRLILNSLRKILKVVTMMLGMRGVTIWMKGN